MTHLDPDALALAALNEDSLTRSQRDHLATCPDCSSELTALRGAVAAARLAPTVELLRPADVVWGRIHDELALSDAVAQQPHVEDASGGEDTGGAGGADDTGGAGDAEGAGDAGDTDTDTDGDADTYTDTYTDTDTDTDTDGDADTDTEAAATADTDRAAAADSDADAVTASSPRTMRSQGTLAFAAVAGLICLVGSVAGGAWRRPLALPLILPLAVVPAIP